MAPFAGRLGQGRLRWHGVEHQLPRHEPPHAMHGTAVYASWEVVSTAEDCVVLEHQLADPWPFAGVVRQELRLAPGSLTARLSLVALEEQPVVLGWHPWFARRLARGGPAELSFEPGRQYLRGEDDLPTGELVPPRPGPWDDCFEGVRAAPRLTWPGALELELVSPTDHWVVFDEEDEAVCVEPQTGPPDAVRLGRAADVPAGGELSLPLELRWSAPASRRAEGTRQEA
jgi:aldose 1-epimerase